MATTKKKIKISAGKAVAIGAGVAAIGAGAYYFLGPKGKQHQKKAKMFVARMEKEANKKIKKAKAISRKIMPVVKETKSAVKKVKKAVKKAVKKTLR